MLSVRLQRACSSSQASVSRNCLPSCIVSRPRGRRVIARGILDSYRREKGLPVPGVDAPAAPASVKEAEEEGEEGGCPVECVKEIFTDAEFDDIISKAPADQLLVFDFWKTACGACRYIQPGFVKLCNAAASHNPKVAFFKHNVNDDEEELTALAERLKIKNVPLFQFYRGGRLVDSFATREKTRIADAIFKHSGVPVSFNQPGTDEAMM